jgi:autotransporter family porin
MKNSVLRLCRVGVFFIGLNLLAIAKAPAALITNTWISLSGGNWDTAGSWSSGLPSINQDTVSITNGVATGLAKSILINAVTTNTAPSSLIISNLFLSNPGLVTNILRVIAAGTNSPTLHIINTLVVSNGAALFVTNAEVEVDGATLDDGIVSNASDGLITTSLGTTKIGNTSQGIWSVLGGTWLSKDVVFGASTGSSGTLTIAGGNSTLASTMKIGNGGNGTVWVTGGQLTVTNDVLYLGYNSPGVCQLTVSNGTAVIGEFDLGEFVGSRGTFTIAGGSTTITVGLFIGVSEGGTRGTVWMTGGQLFTHNASINVGNLGTGQMTLSNGLLQGSSVTVGDGGDSAGTLTVAGGTLTTGFFAAGETDGATGTVWMTGGQLNSTAFTFIGGDGMGQMSMSNGTWQSVNSFVGEGLGGEGTLTVAGGTINETFRMSIGTPDCTGTGTVIIDGGSLFITNASGTALLDLESGTFTLSSGTVVVDQIVMTNACAHFVRTGGTLIYSSAILNPNADADGDGIPNGYEQAHGLDPLNPADANEDNDHDGFSNLQEYLAGTDPNNAVSSFRITSIAKTNSNVLITWMMGPGKTNALQWVAATSNGFYQTNGYANLFIVTNTVGTVTNYLDIGGATNKPARYYRVRLVP